MGGPDRTPAADGAPEAPHVVGARVDALIVAWRARPFAPVVDALAACERLRAGAEHAYPLAGVPLAWRLHGSIWVGKNADVTVRLEPLASKGWCLAAEARAILLMSAGAEVALARLRELLSAASAGSAVVVGRPHDGERLRRLDLAADVAGVRFDDDDRDQWAGRFRRAVRYHRGAPQVKHYGRASSAGWQPTGLAVGFGQPLSVRLYDKTEELAQLHHETEKQATEHARWQSNGWQGSRVWRLEAQLRGDVLDELGIRDPDVALRKVDAVWRYLFGAPGERAGWMRLGRQGATRKRRAGVDPRWVVYQSAVFRARAEAPAERVRKPRGGAEPITALGTVLSTLAARGLLETGLPPDLYPEETLKRDLERFCAVVMEEVATRRTRDGEARPKGDAWDYHARRQGVAARFASTERAERVSQDEMLIRLASHGQGYERITPEQLALAEASAELSRRPAIGLPDWATWARDADAGAVDGYTHASAETLSSSAVCLHRAVGAHDWSIWADRGHHFARRPEIALRLQAERQYRHLIITCSARVRSHVERWWPGSRITDGDDVSCTMRHARDDAFVSDVVRRIEMLEERFHEDRRTNQEP